MMTVTSADLMIAPGHSEPKNWEVEKCPKSWCTSMIKYQRIT